MNRSFALEWSNFSVFSVSSPSWLTQQRGPPQRQHIITGECGKVRKGEFMGILGCSGSGKSTLLGGLSGASVDSFEIEGKVKINGQISSWKQRKEIIGFVEQSDDLMKMFKVKEHLYFMARLRMPNTTSVGRKSRVNELLRMMNLSDCRDSLIQKISVGEQKRLRLATELLLSPSILICDEPTSGLDSYMALSVMKCLKDITKEGITVIISVHQPNTEIFELFNRKKLFCGPDFWIFQHQEGGLSKIFLIHLMCNGCLIFEGERDEALQYFQSFGCAIPDYCTEPDYLVRTLHQLNSNSQQLHAVLAKREHQERNKEQSNLETHQPHIHIMDRKKRAAFPIQFMELLVRCHKQNVRDKHHFYTRLIMALITSFLTGLLYFQTEIRAETVMTINGLLFTYPRITNFAFHLISPLLDEFRIVLKETSSGYYGITSYYLAKTVGEMPQYLILAIINHLVMYFMGGLYTDIESFLFVTLVTILLTFHSTSISYLICYIFADVAFCFNYLSLYINPIFALSGLYINEATIPVYFRWIGFISFQKQAYASLLIDKWSNVEEIPGCSNSSIISCPHTGRELLATLNVGYNRWTPLIVITVLSFAFRAAAYMALRIRLYLYNSKREHVHEHEI